MWKFDAPNSIFKNAALSRALVEQAARQNVFADLFPLTPPSRMARLGFWLWAWLPRMHFGPCDHADCGD